MSSYDEAFFDRLHRGSVRSAREVVPIIIELIRPRTVIDVGCGVGSWLSVFRERGVDIRGVDGDYVSTEQLKIPRDKFTSADLTQPLSISGPFDLAVSLEVAEHLPPENAENFVETLTDLAPIVLFSAAIPLQGGMHHVNEQWPDYWAAIFERNGYIAVDSIRKRVWNNPNVEAYYAQNALLFTRMEYVQKHPALLHDFQHTTRQQLAVVHPRSYLAEANWNRMVRSMAKVIDGRETFIFVDHEMFRSDLPFWPKALPFLEKDQVYWGLPPDGGTAVAELERMRAQGAAFMVFAGVAFWILDYYEELREHLRRRFHCAVDNEHVIIFDLRKESNRAPAE